MFQLQVHLIDQYYMHCYYGKEDNKPKCYTASRPLRNVFSFTQRMKLKKKRIESTIIENEQNNF